MAKITRATQKLFGSLASTDQISKFGSLFAGSPARYSGATATPANIQALANFLDGWASAAIDGNSPAIEDMNAICFLVCYQLAYILQAGIQEWDSGTTYYIGSFASDGLGKIYYSLTDANLNNVLTDASNWALQSNGNAVRTATTTTSITKADGTVRLSGTAGYTATLAAISGFESGQKIVVKNVSSNGSDMIVASSDGMDGATAITLHSTPTFETLTLQKNGAGGWDVI